MSPSSLRVNVALFVAFAAGTHTFAQVAVTVGGQSNPWLSGMPAGTAASYGDFEPAQSPVLVPMTLTPASLVWVTDVVGTVGYAPGVSCPPDGCPYTYCHAPGVQNGIANACWDRASSLVGVFLGDEQPSLTPVPAPSAFNTAALRDYGTTSPALKQVFFIGDGRRSNGDQQRVVVPTGATRLFLGVSDGQGWYNNVGAFTCLVWPSGPTCDSIDFNNDTAFFDPQDIEAFLSVYAEGPCIPATATCNDIDFNNDGSLFDPCDIDSFLLVFSEGPCTLCGE
jgi:hypothetical protein